jgi:cytochrome P450
MYPVAAAGTSRTAPASMRLGGYHIPAGTQLWVPLHVLLNSPHNWDRPDAFLPERWADPEAEFATAAPAAPGSSPARGPGAGAASGAGGDGGDGERASEDGATKRPKRFIPFSSGAGPTPCNAYDLLVAIGA